MAEAWKRQIRHTQFRNHSNKCKKVKAGKEISDTGWEGFMPQGPAMRVDEDGRGWLKIQWRARNQAFWGERDDMCCTQFSTGANQLQRRKDLEHPRKTQVGRGTNSLWKKNGLHLFNMTVFIWSRKTSIPSTWANYSHGHVYQQNMLFWGGGWNNLPSSCAVRKD